MLKRSIKITFRLNKQECERLKRQSQKTGLSQESYLRTLINGYVPRELPPAEYHTIIKELHRIGGNLNQIAAKANATGQIDKTVFQYEANRLIKSVLEIQAAVTSPERRSEFGDNGNMGCTGPPGQGH